MAGLARLCKLYGRMTVRDTASGILLRYVWDYAADAAVLEEEMPVGSERWQASERVRFGTLNPKPTEAARTGRSGRAVRSS